MLQHPKSCIIITCDPIYAQAVYANYHYQVTLQHCSVCQFARTARNDQELTDEQQNSSTQSISAQIMRSDYLVSTALYVIT